MCGISVRVQVPPWVLIGRVTEWLIVVVLKTVAERPRVQIPPRPFIYMVRLVLHMVMVIIFKIKKVWILIFF